MTTQFNGRGFSQKADHLFKSPFNSERGIKLDHGLMARRYARRQRRENRAF